VLACEPALRKLARRDRRSPRNLTKLGESGASLDPPKGSEGFIALGQKIAQKRQLEHLDVHKILNYMTFCHIWQMRVRLPRPNKFQ
jgi:hypothetical protein